MSKEDGVIFSFAGLLTWGAVTAFYMAFGGSLLEAAFWFYVLNALLIGGVVIFVFQSLARLRRVPRGRRLLHAAAFALPGLIGGALALTRFADLTPGAQPESVGRYGALLVFAYAVLVAMVLGRPGRPKH